MSLSRALATNNFGPCKIIVATSAAIGTHTTLASAMAAASAGDTIFLRDSVSESVTITPGVNIAAWSGAALNTVSITGKLTMTGAGTSTISGVRLVTNADFFLAVTGSAASIVNLFNCYLNCSNNTGISFTTSSSSAQINVTNCAGNLGTTGIGLYSQSSAGNLSFTNCDVGNSGGTTTASNNSAGNVFYAYSNMDFPVSSSLTGSTTSTNSIITGGSATSLALTGTGTSAAENSRFTSGAISAVSIGSGCVLEVKGNNQVTSSATNAITGAGQVKFNKLDYYLSSGNDVTTKTAFVSEYGIQKSSLQPAFMAYANSAASNVTGDGTSYTIVCAGEVFDQNNNYNTGTGVFTAPYTGRYQFNCVLGITGLTALFTAGQFTLITSNRNYVANAMNYGAIRSGVDLDLSFSVLADMDVGDTALMQVTVSGSTKTISLRTDATHVYNSFSGFLVC